MAWRTPEDRLDPSGAIPDALRIEEVTTLHGSSDGQMVSLRCAPGGSKGAVRRIGEAAQDMRAAQARREAIAAHAVGVSPRMPWASASSSGLGARPYER